MDEEKQNDSFIKKAGEKAKGAVKQQAKNAAKKVIKKIIMAVLPILIKVLAVVIAILMIITIVAHILDAITGNDSKEANAFAVYDTTSSGNTSSNKIEVSMNNKTEGGAYNLSYTGNTSENSENLIDNLRAELKAANQDVDFSDFTDSQIQQIGILMRNGLDVNAFNAEELKALAVFVKVGIASERFDLRTAEQLENKKEITLADIEANDEVYGIINVYRNKVVEEDDGQVKYEKVKLNYVRYGDATTQGTFMYMKANNKVDDIIKTFTVDGEGNLVIAKWGKTSTKYDYLDTNLKELSEEDKKKIPEDKIKENNESSYITIDKINYKQEISDYILDYGTLSDLLIVTRNPQFCLDLAVVAMNSEITFEINEELTSTVTETTTYYKEQTYLFDYIKYNVSGQKEVITEEWKEHVSGTSEVDFNNLLQQLGNPGKCYQSNTVRYYEEWYSESEKNYIKAEIETDKEQGYNKWKFYIKKLTTTYKDLDSENNSPDTGELIVSDETRFYTAQEIFEYNIKTTTTYLTNKYSTEAEVDCWYCQYEIKHTDPTKKVEEETAEGEVPIKFPDMAETILETEDASQIASDEHVQKFIPQRVEKYKTDHEKEKVKEDTIKCNVTYLRTGRKQGTYEKSTTKTTTTTYEFGDVATTTQINYKNVVYTDEGASFTKSGAEGFLGVYDKYITSGTDLHLKDESEQELFNMLETRVEIDSDVANDIDTSSKANILRFLLSVYDKVDRGVTDLAISIIDSSKYNKGYYGNDNISLYKPAVTKDEFVKAMVEFSEYLGKNENTTVKKNFDWHFLYGEEAPKDKKNYKRAEEIYDWGLKYNVNPELIVVFAWKEQEFKDPTPSKDESNFYGLDMPNGQTDVREYGSFEAGVEKLAEYFKSYSAENQGSWQYHEMYRLYNERYEYNSNGCGLPGTLAGAMSLYTRWLAPNSTHEDGNASKGGRYYLKETYKNDYDKLCGDVHKDGEPYTTKEYADTAACCYEQVLAKWKTIFGKYTTIAGGNVTTDEQAEELTEAYNQMLNTVVHKKNYKKQNGPFPMYWSRKNNINLLTPFQCTWWAYGRASQYLAENNIATKYPSAAQNGGGYYRENVEKGWFNYGQTPKPNSIVCWGIGIKPNYGHVAYVEGVTDEGIYVSHAGSGKSWYGVTFLKDAKCWDYGAPNGYIYLDEPLKTLK